MATAWPAPTRNRERECGQHQRHPAEAVRTPAAASGSPDSLGRDCNEVDLDHQQHLAPIEGIGQQLEETQSPNASFETIIADMARGHPA